MWYLFTCVQATNKKIYFQEAYNNQTWQVLVSYNKGLLRKKSHDCFFTWSIEVTWQMKSDISPHLRHTQQPNLTRCWIISRALHWQSLVALWSRAHMGSGDKFSTLYYFSVKPLRRSMTGWRFSMNDPSIISSREDTLQINTLCLHFHHPWPPNIIR